jgi:TPR repeat protein/RsiW-degrading membrane proteinase PrsW (M82 family)
MGWVIGDFLPNYYIIENQIQVVATLALSATLLAIVSLQLIVKVSSRDWITAALTFAFTASFGFAFFYIIEHFVNNHESLRSGNRYVLSLKLILDFLKWSRETAFAGDAGFFTRLIGFTFGVGLLEELTKALPVIALMLFKKSNTSSNTLIVAGFFSGLAFGVMENFQCYSPWTGTLSFSGNLTRWFACAPSHAVYNTINCVFLIFYAEKIKFYWGRNRFSEATFCVVLSLLTISFVHGFYNTVCGYDIVLLSPTLDFASIVMLMFGLNRLSASHGLDMAEAPTWPRSRKAIAGLTVSLGFAAVLTTIPFLRKIDADITATVHSSDSNMSLLNDYIEWAKDESVEWADEIINYKASNEIICEIPPEVLNFYTTWGFRDEKVLKALDIYDATAIGQWRIKRFSMGEMQAGLHTQIDVRASRRILYKKHDIEQLPDVMNAIAHEIDLRKTQILATFPETWENSGPEGWLKLGLSLIRGRVYGSKIDANIPKGIELIRKASDQGLSEASMRLARIYEGKIHELYYQTNEIWVDNSDDGEAEANAKPVVEEDIPMARKLYMLSFNQGNIDALTDLFILEETAGSGDQNLKILKQAIDLKSQRAQKVWSKILLGHEVYSWEKYSHDPISITPDILGITNEPQIDGLIRSAKIHLEGLHVEKDTVAGLRLLRKSADLGSNEGRFLFAYQLTLNPERDVELPKAVEYLRASALSGHQLSQILLGSFYQRGFGCDTNTVEAIKLYEMAFANKSAHAAVLLGLIYEYGDGVDIDLIKARSMYSFAVNNGLLIAENYIKRLSHRSSN